MIALNAIGGLLGFSAPAALFGMVLSGYEWFEWFGMVRMVLNGLEWFWILFKPLANLLDDLRAFGLREGIDASAMAPFG